MTRPRIWRIERDPQGFARAIVLDTPGKRTVVLLLTCGASINERNAADVVARLNRLERLESGGAK